MTGVILAGGENSRMGSHKAFLSVNGKPLIERILAVHGSLFPRTIIVTRSPDRFRSYPVEIAEDASPVRGPLTGIYTAMLRSPDDRFFVNACDMPFLDPRLIAYLCDRAGDHDALVPRVNGYPEPLHAVYHRRILPVIEELLRNGERRIQRLFDHVQVIYTTEEEIGSIDPHFRSFININTPQEYKEAVCSDSACRN